MERLQAGGGLDAVADVYRQARNAAQAATPFWLRWRYRQLQRTREQLDHAGLAGLRAVTDELQSRGLDLPEVQV